MFDGSMTTSLHTFYYPFHKLGFVNTHRTLYKPRLNPGLAITPSSVLSHKDESGKFLEYKKGSGPTTASTNNDSSNSLLGLANTVGIIGGVSLVSTLNFLRKLVQWSSKDGGSCPPFVLCSDPVLSKELLLVERSSIPSPSSKIESTKLDPTPIVENLRSKRIYLENSGARCIVMPCHIAHCWHDEISEGCSVPFLHMGECVAKELKEAKLKPLEAGSPLQIGVLATNETLTAGFYQEKLQSEGFEVVLPDKATMEHTVIPAIEALNRKDIEGAQNLLRIALQVILVRAVNSVILASDDMRNLLPRDDPLLKKCIDPMDALAWSTTKWAQSAEKDIWKKCRLVKPQKVELKKVRDLPPNERSAVFLLSDEQIGTSGVNFPSPKRNLRRAREMVLNRNDPECSAKIAKKVDKGKGRKPTRGVSSHSQSDPPENTPSSPSSVQPPGPTIQTSPHVQPMDHEKRKAPEVKTERNKRTRQEPHVGSDCGESMTVGAHLSGFVRSCVNVLTPSFIKKMWAPAEHPDFDEMAVLNSKQIMKLALQQFEVAREAVKAAKQLKSYKDKHEASDAALAEEKQMREEEHKRATELQVQLNTMGAERALLAKNLEASDKRVAALEKLNRDLQNDVLEAEKKVLEEREVGVQAAMKARHDGFWNLIDKIQTKHPEWNLDFVAEGSDEEENNIED